MQTTPKQAVSHLSGLKPNFNDPLISVMTVIDNDADTIPTALPELAALVREHYPIHEILIVDNGSTDSSVEIVRNLQASLPNIRLLVLSKHYDTEIAFAAALDQSIGEYVLLFDLNSDPIALIPELINTAKAGHDIVIGTSSDRAQYSKLHSIGLRWFYTLYGRVVGVQAAPEATHFRVLNRKVVNSMIKIRSKQRYLKHFNALIGFKQASFPYQPQYRKQPTPESWMHLLWKASDLFISHSLWPLRAVTLLGLFASFLNLLFLGYVLIVSLFKQQLAEGWFSTSVVNGTMFFILFIILTVVAEYIARILIETKDQPLYFVAEEYTSDIISPIKDRLNIV